MQIKTFDLTTLNGANGFSITGVLANGLGATLGYSVSSAGDINGDGISDLVLGAPVAGNGTSYVIFGSRTPFPTSFNLANLNGSNGFTIPGVAAGGWLGSSVSSAGDINGDGISDLVLGAPNTNYSRGVGSYGSGYVIFGSQSGFPVSFNLTNLNGNNGFTIPGIDPLGALGWSVSTSFDINGDGLSDLVLGAWNANGSNGTSYVIFGSRNPFPASFNLMNLNGSNGFAIPGITGNGQLGSSVSTAGDMNGDGLSDLVLGAPFAGNGTSYVIFGSRNPFPASFNLTNLNGSNGFTIPGVTPVVVLVGGLLTGGGLGYSVSIAGDINNDSISDLVLGARSANSWYGESYVIFGSRSSFPALFNLTTLNGSNGFTIPGVNVGRLGSSVATAGDVNSDGVSDLVLGATSVNSGIGASYVIFGGFASILFTRNALTITEGQIVGLNNTNLNAISIIPLPFTITEVKGGRFTFVNDSATAIFSFTQSQINNNQIQFISDRTNIVSYQVGMMNITNNQTVYGPIPANVNFINYAPVVLNPPAAKTVNVGESFYFAFVANSIFNDVDGDPLSYTAELSDGSALPSWLNFDASTANGLAFNGTALTQGTTQISLIAKDPLNASVSTGFGLVATNNGTSANILTSAAQITGEVIGSALGLAAAIGAGLGFWRYSTNKTSRSTEQFADLIRTALNLKGVDNFGSEEGQNYVAVIHKLENALKTAGIDTQIMRGLERQQLARDVAEAACNKISSAMDCLGRSVITVTDLNDNLQNLVNEVQVLRAGGQKNRV